MASLPNTATIGVIGAGTMGAGIAQVAATAGHPVILFDAQDGAAVRAIAGISVNLARLAEKGKLAVAEKDRIVARITPARSLSQLKPCVLTIEAVVEDLAAKRKLLADLEPLVSPESIIATNTSSLSITSLAAGLRHPGRFAGMHFFNPVPQMALVEIVSGLVTSPGTAAICFDTAAVWGKSPVHVRSTPGFVVNRVARPFYGEALRLLEEGAADVATLDAVMRESGGFRMGPFELMDMIGHDVNYAVTCSVWSAYHHDPRFEPSLLQHELVSAGRLGRKTGQGFYDYTGGEPTRAGIVVPPAAPPGQVTIHGNLGYAEPLAALAERSGLPVFRRNAREPGGWIEADGTRVALTDGRTATQRAAEDGHREWVVFDLAHDYATASRVALASADQCSAAGLEAAVGLFQALHKKVSVLDDVPGLAVMRTVAMLANEGADTVRQRVCDAMAVDTAMQKGVNYPRGPLLWAESIGLPAVLAVIDNLAGHYGDDRYRASPLLRRRVWGGQRFHG